MHRVIRPLRARKLVPLAAGFVAAFGTIWFSCKDHFYFTDSYGSMLWHYLVPGFLKSNNVPHVPGKHPTNPQSSTKLPNIQIRKNEKLVPVNVGIVSHYETNNLASNEPIEDRNLECFVRSGIMFGVFDGHSGWQCADEVMKRLPYYIALSMSCTTQRMTSDLLEELIASVKNIDQRLDRIDNVMEGLYGKKAKEYCENNKIFSVEINIEQQLKNAYKLLDEDIVSEAIPDVNGHDDVSEKVMKGLSGACAITAYIQDSELYVASSGDCRVVLGSKGHDGKWKATSLSMDQNAFNPEEVERLKLEHPGEDNVIRNNRLLGYLQPFRAFGDVIFKWDSSLHEEYLNKIYGRVVIPRPLYRSPPYLTAEPVVTRHNLQSGDKFLVIASDGLWDMISNDGAVQCIGALLESGNLISHVDDKSAWHVNGASQLIQEALGGDDEIKVTRLLAAPIQIRRALRDDITVTVVYFTQRN